MWDRGECGIGDLIPNERASGSAFVRLARAAVSVSLQMATLVADQARGGKQKSKNPARACTRCRGIEPNCGRVYVAYKSGENRPARDLSHLVSDLAPPLNFV